MLNPTVPQPAPMLMPNLSNMSTKELEAEYTKLIVLERNVDRTLNAEETHGRRKVIVAGGDNANNNDGCNDSRRYYRRYDLPFT